MRRKRMRIKPCPFYGSKIAILPVNIDDGPYIYMHVVCPDPQCFLNEEYYADKEELLERWNRREEGYPKYVPFTGQDMIQLLGEAVYERISGIKYLVTSISIDQDDVLMLHLLNQEEKGTRVLSSESLLKYFMFADETPCGKDQGNEG